MKRKVGCFLVTLLMAGAVGRAQPEITAWGSTSYSTNVPANATNVVALAAGDAHVVALRGDGTVLAWGANGLGQTNVPPDLTNVVSVAAGSTHSLALRSGGTLVRWGWLLIGGDSSVPASATNLVAVALGPGALHFLALRADGTVMDWGNTSYGLTNIPATAVDIVAVAAGSYHSLALRADGRVVAWGSNSNGQTNVPPSATNIVAIATGWFGNAALRADGTLLAWGGTSTPPPIYGLTNLVDVVCPFNIFMGGSALLGLRRDGTLVEYQGMAIPPYPTNGIAAIAAGGQSAFALVGKGRPVFPGLPVNRTVVGGARAHFRMPAVGAMPLAYQWSCDGTNIPGATNVVLTLTNVQPVIAGNSFTLTVTNAEGAATSGPMLLNVVPSEVFIRATNSFAVIGATVTFTSSIIGQGPLAYQWQFNGTNLPGATNAAFTLTDLELADAGLYSLIASNSYGFATNSVSLAVAPTIATNPPQNQWGFPGGTAVFSIGLQAVIPVSYQWQFNGVDLPGATTDQLTLANLDYAQAGRYSVVVSNAYEVTTNSAILVVSPVAGWGRNTSAQISIPDGLTNIAAVAGGETHSVALRRDGTVVVWGNGARAAVPGDLTNAVSIAAGYWGTLALRADGTVAAWGVNGTGTTNVPVGLTNVVAVAAGYLHNLALRSDGAVVAWGLNSSGETNVPLDLTNAIAIAAGDASLALTADGRVRAWGDNGNGQTNVPSGLSNVVAIAAGQVHSMALKADGTVAVWGSTSDGLQNIPAAATNIVAIGAGYVYCIALRADGTVVAWGRSTDGQTTIPTGLANVSAIAAGTYHNLAIVSEVPVVWLPVPTAGSSIGVPRYIAAGGSVQLQAGGNGTLVVSYQWQFNGTNIAGATNATLNLTAVQLNQAGLYSVIVTSPFGTVAGSATSVIVVPSLIVQQPADQLTFPGATATFTVAVQANVPVRYQWQFNGADLPDATNAMLVLDNVRLDQTGAYSVTISNEFGVVQSVDAALALSRVVAWGYNSNGQTNMIPNLTNVVSISAGGYHNLALRPDGTVMAWGAGTVDQGYYSGNLGQSMVPDGLSNVLAVAGGGYHSLALKADHTVVAWGAGTVNAGYDPNLGQSIVPQDLTNVVAIACGYFFSLALKADGTVVTWGDGAYGLADVPSDLTNAVAIAAGSYHSVALHADGTVVSWGESSNGETNVPAGLSNVVAIAAGAHQNLAVRADGTAVTWGISSYGLGTIPGTASNIIAAACDLAGNDLVLLANGGVVAWGRGADGQTNAPSGLKNVVAISSGAAHNLTLIGDGPPDLVAPVAGPIWVEGAFRVLVQSVSGRVYRLEYMNSLDDGQWTPLPLVAGSGDVLTLTDHTALAPHRFYRVRQW